MSRSQEELRKTELTQMLVAVKKVFWRDLKDLGSFIENRTKRLDCMYTHIMCIKICIYIYISVYAHIL